MPAAAMRGGEYSPFTQALLANMKTPGLDIRISSARCGIRCSCAPDNAQEPFTYGSLPWELYSRALDPLTDGDDDQSWRASSAV
jgi:hypothetical protein